MNRRNVIEAQMPKFAKKYWFKVWNNSGLKKYCLYYYQYFLKNV